MFNEEDGESRDVSLWRPLKAATGTRRRSCLKTFHFCSSGNSTETAIVDENTHEFFTELSEPGTYRARVSTLSSSGDCEARESSADAGVTFYLSES